MGRAGIVHVVVPVGLEGKTGGYVYDRRIVQGLRALGWSVLVHTLDASFPVPTEAALRDAAAVFESLADQALVLVDGLAYGAMPALAETHGQRLRLVALVHHPLALETGLSAEQAQRCRREETRALAVARRVIVTSTATARELASYEVPAERVEAVLPGTDLAELATGSGAGALQLLCVATLTPRKGHAILLDALSDLRDRRWHLVCAGSTERHPATTRALRQQVQALGLDARVHFTGELDELALARCYAGADLFVLASYYEGYGMVFDEALARGLPIVSTRGGAIIDTVPGDAGVLVPPGDAPALRQALVTLMDHPEQLEPLRIAARRVRARQRRWPEAATDFARALKQVARPAAEQADGHADEPGDEHSDPGLQERP